MELKVGNDHMSFGCSVPNTERQGLDATLHTQQHVFDVNRTQSFRGMLDQTSRTCTNGGHTRSRERSG